MEWKYKEESHSLEFGMIGNTFISSGDCLLLGHGS